MIKKNISLIISFLICIVALTSCEPKSDVESVVKHQTEIRPHLPLFLLFLQQKSQRKLEKRSRP